MKLIFSILLIMNFVIGCTPFTSPEPTENKKLSDVHYDVNKEGKVKLVKTYTNTPQPENETDIKKTRVSQKNYERVPSFNKNSSKSLSLGRKKHPADIVVNGKTAKISVESIPLNEFIDLVFSSVLKLNYTVNKNVKSMKNPITLNMQTTQKASELYKVVEKILQINGVSIRKESGTFFIYKNNPKANNNNFAEDIYISYGTTLPNGIKDEKTVLVFVPYNYIKGGVIVNLLRQVGMRNVSFYNTPNGIQMMRGKAKDVKEALKLVHLLDRPNLDGKIAYLINFENIEVNNFTEQMKKIFQLNNINVDNSPSKGGITLLPIKDLNGLYIVTPKKEWLDMLLYWKEKLDTPSEVEESPRLYVYKVRNRKADDLAGAVNQVLGITKSTKKTKTANSKPVAGEMQKKETVKTEKERVSDSFLISQVNYTPTVTADLETNILMLKLTPKHYKVLLPFIKKLDKLPLQTLVEVTIAEVTMTDTFSLGFEYAIRDKGLGIDSVLSMTGGGNGLGIVFNSSKIDATINAFAEDQLLDIVSKPKMLILNNSTGNINVGTQVPIVTSETSASDVGGTTPSIVRNISYRNTGVVLGLTPTINSRGVLTMNISINLSEAQTNDTSGIDSPLIVNRQLDTVAVINSGSSILIGGLISHNISESAGGIPLLRDIPWIGSIFQNQSKKTTKTELIMLIKPIIINTPSEIDAETLKYKSLLSHIKRSNL